MILNDINSNFYEWLVRNKCKIDHVNIEYLSSYNRILKAKNNFNKFEIILEIDNKVILDSSKIISYFGNEIIEFFETYKHSFFALYIILEKKNEFWQKYFEIFPKKFDFEYFKDFYSKNCDQLFKLSSVKKQKVIDEFYKVKEILKDQKDLSLISLEEFFFAKLVISSRLFSLELKSKKSSGLVPLADFMNHSKDYNCIWKNDPLSNNFILEALDDIKKGEELLEFYGPKSNDHLMLNYGFCMVENEFNSILFDFCLQDENNMNLRFELQFFKNIEKNISSLDLLRIVHFKKFLILEESYNQKNLIDMNIEDIKKTLNKIKWKKLDFYSYNLKTENEILNLILKKIEYKIKHQSENNEETSNEMIKIYKQSYFEDLKELKQIFSLCKKFLSCKNQLSLFEKNKIKSYIKRIEKLELDE